MSGDRLAEIEERCEFFGQHSGWVTLPSRDVLALVEIAKAAREEAAAVKAVLGTLGYYIGPNARTAVSTESVRSYERVRDANKAQIAALARLDSGGGAK